MLGPDNLAEREYIYSLIDPAGVKVVLDIGCGQGYDLAQLGERLPSATKFIGLDKSEKAIEAAPANRLCRFVVHDASDRLPFQDESFDLIFSRDFLECVEDKQALIKEMRRVLCATGQIVCAHHDWDTQVFDGVDKALVRKIVHAYADWQQAWMDAADGWMGRRLWSEFQRSPLFNGRIETYTLTNTEYAEPFYGHMNIQAFAGLVRRGMIAEEEYAAFRSEIERLAERNEYFYSINMYIYTGRKA